MGILNEVDGSMPRDFLDINMLSRAQWCLLGQLVGDSLGSLVEFRSQEDIRREYPNWSRNTPMRASHNNTPQFGEHLRNKLPSPRNSWGQIHVELWESIFGGGNGP